MTLLTDAARATRAKKWAALPHTPPASPATSSAAGSSAAALPETADGSQAPEPVEPLGGPVAPLSEGLQVVTTYGGRPPRLGNWMRSTRRFLLTDRTTRPAPTSPRETPNGR